MCNHTVTSTRPYQRHTWGRDEPFTAVYRVAPPTLTALTEGAQRTIAPAVNTQEELG